MKKSNLGKKIVKNVKNTVKRTVVNAIIGKAVDTGVEYISGLFGKEDKKSKK